MQGVENAVKACAVGAACVAAGDSIPTKLPAGLAVGPTCSKKGGGVGAGVETGAALRQADAQTISANRSKHKKYRLSKKSFCQAGGRGSKLPRHCHPFQFPLKSYGFPGADTAKKRFLLWKMGFSGAKIAPSPPYTPPGTIETRKGFAPLLGFLTV